MNTIPLPAGKLPDFLLLIRSAKLSLFCAASRKASASTVMLGANWMATRLPIALSSSTVYVQASLACSIFARSSRVYDSPRRREIVSICSYASADRLIMFNILEPDRPRMSIVQRILSAWFSVSRMPLASFAHCSSTRRWRNSLALILSASNARTLCARSPLAASAARLSYDGRAGSGHDYGYPHGP